MGCENKGKSRGSVVARLEEKLRGRSSVVARLEEKLRGRGSVVVRIEEKLRGRDIHVTRQTLANLLKTLGVRVLPLFELMRERLLAGGCIFTDDTPIKLQARGKCREARIWLAPE